MYNCHTHIHIHAETPVNAQKTKLSMLTSLHTHRCMDQHERIRKSTALRIQSDHNALGCFPWELWSPKVPIASSSLEDGIFEFKVSSVVCMQYITHKDA